MEHLGVDKLRVFWKYYQEFENMYDHRNGNMYKKILKEISKEEIETFLILEENYMLLRTGVYSLNLQKEFQKNINKYKNLVSTEALEYLKKGEKPKVLKNNNPWYSRIFNTI